MTTDTPTRQVAAAAAAAELRGYQQLAVNLVSAELAATGQAHLALPTGSGKSRVLGELARLTLDQVDDPGPGTVLVVSPRKQITAQLAGALAAATGHRATTLPIATPGEDSVAGPIVVGGAVTLLRWSARNTVEPTLILVDEAHHATAAGCRRLLDTYPDAHRVGVTATPYRNDGDRLDEVLGRCVLVRDPDHPDMAGVLAPVEWEPVRVPADLGAVTVGSTKTGRDYQDGALGAVLTTPAAIAATVTGTAGRIRGRPTVVFAATIDHAETLAAAYTDVGLRVGQVFATTPVVDRDRAIEALTRGTDHPNSLDVLVTVGALTEGFDCPPVAALVIARPTRSELLYTQMLGRGLRVSPAKGSCLVLDVTGIDGTAGPTATGQVFTPTILPSALSSTTDSDGPDREPGDWCQPPGEGGGPLTRQLVGTGRRSPAWAWAAGPDGVLQVALADDKVGVLVPDGPSGLWRPLLIDVGGVAELDGPLPARYAVDRFVGLASQHLTRAGSAWRSHPATSSQLRKLRGLDWTLAERATSEAWSKGHASDVIAALATSRTLARHAQSTTASETAV